MKDTVCCYAAQGQSNLAYVLDEGNPHCIKLILKLASEIEIMINKGCTTFITGADGWMEIWFAESVLDLQHAYPEKNIRLIVVTPYQRRLHRLCKTYSMRYEKVMSQANEVCTMGKHYYTGCIVETNQHMIKQSCHMIAVTNGKDDNIKSAIEYAENAGLDISILNPSDFFNKKRTWLWNIR